MEKLLGDAPSIVTIVKADRITFDEALGLIEQLIRTAHAAGVREGFAEGSSAAIRIFEKAQS